MDFHGYADDRCQGHITDTYGHCIVHHKPEDNAHSYPFQDVETMMVSRSEEAKDRDAFARVIAWALDRPKMLMVVIGLLAGTGVWREAARMMQPEPRPELVLMGETQVRAIVKEELAPVREAQAEGNRRLGNIESALILRGLRADASHMEIRP